MSKRSRDEWKQIIARFEQSGETRSAFAIRHGIKPSLLSWWVSALKRADAASLPKRKRRAPAVELLPVAITGGESRPAAIGLEVAFNEVVVRFPAGTAAEYVGAVVLEIKALC